MKLKGAQIHCSHLHQTEQHITNWNSTEGHYDTGRRKSTLLPSITPSSTYYPGIWYLPKNMSQQMLTKGLIREACSSTWPSGSYTMCCLYRRLVKSFTSSALLLVEQGKGWADKQIYYKWVRQSFYQMTQSVKWITGITKVQTLLHEAMYMTCDPNDARRNWTEGYWQFLFCCLQYSLEEYSRDRLSQR